jgi:hypothetical protein
MSHRTAVIHLDDHSSHPLRSFGASLRKERERRNVSIASIAESTKVLGALFEGLENDNLSRWPEGFYRRSFVRAYAEAIGLNPDAVLREFLDHYPERNAGTGPGSDSAIPPADLRLMLDCPHSSGIARFARTMRDRVVAFAVDSAIVAGVTGGLGVAVGLVWEPLAIVACAYYSVGVLILGTTPATFAFRSRPVRLMLPTGFSPAALLDGLVRRVAAWMSFEIEPKAPEPVCAPPPPN